MSSTNSNQRKTKWLVATTVILFLMFMMGCAGPYEYDKLVDFEGAPEHQEPYVFAKTEGNKLELDLEDVTFRSLELMNLSLSVKSCDRGTTEMLISSIMKEDVKDYCRDLECTVDSVNKSDRHFYVNATCDRTIAESGDAYMIGLNATTKIPKSSIFGVMMFRSCKPEGDYDICTGEFRMVLEKR